MNILTTTAASANTGSQFTMYIILVGILLAIVYFVGGFKDNKPFNTDAAPTKKSDTPISAGKPVEKKPEDGTRRLPQLLIDQFNETNHIIKTLEISSIPADGLYVSRFMTNRAPFQNEVFLEKDKLAETASEAHFGLAIDDEGMYIKDNDSANHLYLAGSNQPSTAISLYDGIVVYAGAVPLRFRFPKQSHEFIDDGMNLNTSGTIHMEDHPHHKVGSTSCCKSDRFGVVHR